MRSIFFHSIFFSLVIFSLDFFSLFIYQGLERKNKRIMQITWFVLFYMIQAWIKNIEKRTRKHSQTENQTDWLVHL